MAVGFEAKARIDVDVSSFLRASREAARAAGTLGTAVRSLNKDLAAMQVSARNVSQALRPLNTTLSNMAKAAGHTGQAASQLSQGLRQNTQAFQTASQASQNYARTQTQTDASLRRMGQELARLRVQSDQYNAALATGVRLNRTQQESFDAVNRRIGTLTQQYIRLTVQQRQTVDSSRNLALATRNATEAAQQQEAAQVRLNRVGALTHTQLQSLGREMQRTAQQRQALRAAQQQGITLSVQEVQVLRQLTARLTTLDGRYRALSMEQQRVVDSSRRLAETSATVATVNRRVADSSNAAASGMRSAQRAAGDLDGSMFALRSALHDVEGGLRSIARTGQQALTTLAQVFSAQEMATAHLARVTQETDAMVRGLANSIRELSVAIPVPFEDLARIGVLGAQVGIANTHLLEFIETVALFSATTDVAEEDAALLFARIVQMTSIDPTQIQNLGAAVSELGSNSAATEQEILTTIESISTVASQAGLAETTILGLGGAMASLRIRPELARGAVQRVFLELEQTAIGAKDGMDGLITATGMTDRELRALAENDVEQFLFRVLEGLGGLADEGQNLIPILREIGVINTRDADVVARLAGNYQLLEDSVALANRSFAEGTFLHQESARLFETLTARTQMLANQWQNFLNTIFEAVAPVALMLVEAASSVVEFLDSLASLNPALTAIVVGGGALVTVLAALGAAVAAAARSYIAFRQVMAAVTAVQASHTTATAAGTAATAAQTGALTGLTAAAGRAAVALRAAALAHPVTALLALGTAVVGAAAAYDVFTDSATRHERAVLRANESHMMAAGGLEGLREAIREDTAAWEDATQAAEATARAQGLSADEIEDAVSRVSDAAARRVTTTNEVTDATREEMDATRDAAEGNLYLQEQLHGSAKELRERRDALDGDTEAIDRNISLQEGLEESIDANSRAWSEQEVAIGSATRAMAAASLEGAIMETEIAKSAEAMQVLRDSGADIGAALDAELREAGSGAENLRQHAEAVRQEMDFWDKSGAGWRGVLHGLSVGLIDVTSDAEDAARAYEAMADNLDATTLTIDEAIVANELLGNELIDLGNGVRFTAEELAELDVTAFGLEQTLLGLDFTVEELRDGIASFVDPLDAWREAQENANQAVIDADDEITSLSENAAVNFSDFIAGLEDMVEAQMNWSSNLLELADQVPPEVLAGLAEMGSEGADIVAGLVDATDEEVDRFVELWQHGGGQMLDDFTLIFADFVTMAAAAGDDGGRDFANDLLAEVGRGEISMGEAIDRMTEYAETEFADAKPVIEGEMDDSEVLQTIADLLKDIRNFQADANDSSIVEPSLDSSGFWDSISSWWSGVKSWWNNNVAGGLRVSPQVSGDYSGSGSYGPLPRADGGWVSGPGGPREDKIPALLSDREFVVNARSAREFGPLLEWINSQRGSGGSQIMTPNFVPNDIFEMPRRPLSQLREQVPEAVQRGREGMTGAVRERIAITINNQYPQAEPSSVTVNRALAYAAALDGLD